MSKMPWAREELAELPDDQKKTAATKAVGDLKTNPLLFVGVQFLGQ